MTEDKKPLAANKARRYAIHVNEATWTNLRKIAVELNISMSSLVQFFSCERETSEIERAYDAKPMMRVRPGRKKKTFHAN